MPYRSLDPERIIETVESLSQNMQQRFGGRGLTKVALELTEFAKQEAGLARKLARPRLFLRFLVLIIILTALAVFGVLIWSLRLTYVPSLNLGLGDLESIEALLNMLMLLAAGLWVLLNLETRMKRHDVLVRINQLRSIAHVIDMHQLSKDPMADLHTGAVSETPPESDLQGYALVRYLDYCADLLAITGKLAAVYLEYIEDPVVLTTINDFESLTGEMARKIWQKVTVLELQGSATGLAHLPEAEPTPEAPAPVPSPDLPKFLE